jgi:multicomponent Na+:H+ antiporter subunit E
MRILRKIGQVFGFTAFYAREMVLANLHLAWDAVTPTQLMHPAVLELPLDAKTDLEILLVGNLLTMTPGTLCMDVSPDHRIMYVHAMYAEDRSSAIAHLKTLEHRILAVLR